MRQTTEAVSLCSINETPGRLDHTKIVEIIVPSSGEPDKLSWLMGERQQALTQGDRNRSIVVAMRDEQRSADSRDAPIGMKLIPHHRLTGTMRSSAAAPSAVDV